MGRKARSVASIFVSVALAAAVSPAATGSTPPAPPRSAQNPPPMRPAGRTAPSVTPPTPLPTAPFTWTALGPQPISNSDPSAPWTGRVTAIAPTNVADTIYLGGASGGVWKTIDAGVTWTP